MIASKKDFEKHFNNATRGSGAGHKGRRFVTYEMMERDSVVHAIEKTRVEPNRIIIGRGEGYILRRRIR